MTESREAPVLCARGLTRVFPGPPERVALSGVELAVSRGECLVVAGPSGSGKTTLLQLVIGIDTPSAGSVELLGQSIAGLSARARARFRLAHLGLVLAEDNLCPALTLRENAELPLAALGVGASERRRRLDGLFDSLGLAALAGSLPDRVSSGERQRAALARALSTEPRLLVADEPTAHLDSASAAAWIELVTTAVARSGLAVVLATHDERLLARADRVLRLVDGRRQDAA